MTRFSFLLVTFLAILSLYSCKSKSIIIDTSAPELEEMLVNLFSEKHKCILNQTESLILCYADDDPIMDPDRKAYVVIDNAYNIVVKKSRVNGLVEWHDDRTLTLKKWSRNANKQSKIREQKVEYLKIDNTNKEATYEF